MALNEYIVELRIFSSLESLADRCEVVLGITPDSPDFLALPLVGETYEPTLYLNNQPISFDGIVVERDFQFDVSSGAYAITLHLYDRVMKSLLEVYYSSKKADIIENVEDVLGLISVIIENHPVLGDIDIDWKLERYTIFGERFFSGRVVDVLHNLAEFSSVSEIRKIFMHYEKKSGSLEKSGVVVERLNLMSSRISGMVIPPQRILSVNIGEEVLPEIRKAIIRGALNTILDLTDKTTTYETEADTGERTEVRTTTSFDLKGRVVTVKTQTRSAPPSGGLALIKRETVDYSYTPSTNFIPGTNILEYTNVLEEELSVIEKKKRSEPGLYRAMEVKVRYAYDSLKQLTVKVIDSQEYGEDNSLKKVKKEVSSYHKLVDGVTQVKTENYSGKISEGEVESYDIKTTTVETYYGPPPTGESSPFGVVGSQAQRRLTVDISGNVHAEVMEYYNSSWLDMELSSIASQVRELDRAKRIDISVALPGDPSIKKGNAYKIQDVRANIDMFDTGTMLNFVAVEVIHEFLLGISYTTTIQGVCYEPKGN